MSTGKNQLSMRIWVFSIMRNEATLLPYWLRHYTTFAERIIVYDDNSDDGSRELLTNAGVDVRDYPATGIDETVDYALTNSQYKEARGFADWVMWVDGDEFIYHPHLVERLAELAAKGVTMPHVQGYNMCADAPPVGNGQIYEEIYTGVKDNYYSKPEVINPSLEFEWGVGRDSRGMRFADKAVRESDGQPPLKLLHYRWLGRDYFLARNRARYERYCNPKHASNQHQVAENFDGVMSLAWYDKLSRRATRVV